MWRLLGEPVTFHVIEAGSGDGSLARAIVAACPGLSPAFARALYYVAADYQPWWPPGADLSGAHRVRAEGLRGFRNLTGCVLSNELFDNFPVHRFEVRNGEVLELLVSLDGDAFVDLPAAAPPAILERLSALGIPLPDGMRGEVCLELDAWASQVAGALRRGFVLSIDYGDLAPALYTENPEGTLVCFSRHVAGLDPFQEPGSQDITSQVDFTSLMRAGEAHGLTTAGYTTQARFLEALGFGEHIDALEAQDMPEAARELRRMALTSLVDPDELGNLKVLAQARGLEGDVVLDGFSG
jgi:SAM-dependent MidA family methyltransferase